MLCQQRLVAFRQPDDVLARLEGADEQEVIFWQLQRAAVVIDRLRRQRLEALVHAEQMHRDLVGRHVEHRDQVALAGFAVGQNVVSVLDGELDLIVVVTAALVGEKLRVMQKGQIVYGDDLAARAELRRDEIGGVEHVEVVRQQLDPQRDPLEPVMRRRPQCGAAEVIGVQLDQRVVFIFLAAVENRVAVLAVDPLQRFHEAHDIGADAPAAIVG